MKQTTIDDFLNENEYLHFEDKGNLFSWEPILRKQNNNEYKDLKDVKYFIENS